MKKKRTYRLPILALILILVLGCLTGCGKDTGAQASNTVDLSIVDVSVTEPEEPASEEPDVEEPDTEEPDAEDEAETDAEQTDPAEVQTEAQPTEAPEAEQVAYYFRNAKLLGQHYEKHGIEMGFASEEEYEAAASAVINNPNALHKTEKEDGDGIYYVEETNEFVVLSKDGYIRTYFWPSAGIKYYNRQ